ncbi:MAG TPA: sulfotransferase family 2 domain-containing protein [Anaerolineales bacterium]|nr:sulfotransferase family 2 domain-containing protein [Anaerolineales bacterium]
MTEKIFRPAWPYTLGSDEKLYFLHIAKTAGRSFENLLKRFFPTEKIIRIDVEHGYPANFPEKVFTDYQLYLGHLGHFFIELFPENKRPFWITMLRNPVERVVSYYYFLRNIKPTREGHIRYRHQTLACALNLLDFVRNDETREIIDNMQFHTLVDSEILYFNNVTGLKYQRTLGSTPELVTLVKHRLENECLFFGITEQYELSVAMLCYALNWDLPTLALDKLNVTPDKPSFDEIVPEVIKAIRDRVELDLEIYNFACELFERRIITMVNRLIAENKAAATSSFPLEIYTKADPQTQNKPVSPAYEKELLLQKASMNSLVGSPIYQTFYTLWVKAQELRMRLRQFVAKTKYPPLFDEKWYLSQNPDVANSQVNPFIHYKMWGWKEGRNPSPGFDVLWYLSNNPDVLQAGVEPLEHYLTYGQKEKRSPLPPYRQIS